MGGKQQPSGGSEGSQASSKRRQTQKKDPSGSPVSGSPELRARELSAKESKSKKDPKRGFDPRAVFAKMGLGADISHQLAAAQDKVAEEDTDSSPAVGPNRDRSQAALSHEQNLSILQGTFSDPVSDPESASLEALNSSVYPDSSVYPAAAMNPSAIPDPDPSQESLSRENLLQSRLEKAVRQRQEVEAQLMRLEAEAKAQKLAHQQELDQLRQRIAQQDKVLQKQSPQQLQLGDPGGAVNGELEAQIQNLSAQLETRQRLNERQRQDIERLQAQLQQKDLDTQQLQRQWESRQQELQIALVEAEDLAQKRVDMLQRFKAELALARTQTSELETALKQLKSLHANQQAAWQEQREHLEARLQGSFETEAEAEQRWQELRQELEEVIANQKEQIQILEQQLLAQSAQGREGQQRQQTLEQRLSHAEEMLAAAQAQQTQLQAQFHLDQAEILDLNNRLAVMGSRLTESQSRLPELLETQRKLQQAEERRAGLEHKLAQQTQTLLAQGNTIQDLEAEIQLLTQKLNDQQQHNLRLKAALDRNPGQEQNLKHLKDPTLQTQHRLSKPDPRRIPTGALARELEGAKDPLPQRPKAGVKAAIDLPGFLRT